MRKKAKKEYKIIGAFDTETSNIDSGFSHEAFYCLYQLGLLTDCDITELNALNFERKINTKFYRHYHELYLDLENLLGRSYVPVILVHNLGFDMYALAPFFDMHTTRVLAKTAQKPITFTIVNPETNEPELVFLDTLSLFMKPLDTMGVECGIPKATGSWDYSKIRTPETPLTKEEEFYARRDIETLLVYMAYWLNKNPDIEPGFIGSRVMTKTGVVRAKRDKIFGGLRADKARRNTRQLWNYMNRAQAPKTDGELFTMHAATRGGLTFCASKHASVPFLANKSLALLGYDATSQHPGQMASHMYPQNFTPATAEELEEAYKTIAIIDTDKILENWRQPFPLAFNALFGFRNLRPKEGSIYKKHGIYPLASARLYGEVIYDNEPAATFKNAIAGRGYGDMAINPTINFGKIEASEYVELYVTELALWEILQAYDFDSIEPIGGYLTNNFTKPTDYSLLSVMHFYKAKNALKEVMSGADASLLDGLYPDSFVDGMKRGDVNRKEQKEYYQLAKADLNALFG